MSTYDPFDMGKVLPDTATPGAVESGQDQPADTLVIQNITHAQILEQPTISTNAPAPSNQLFFDDLIGPNGTPLNGRMPNVGPVWVAQSQIQLDGSQRIKGTSGTNFDAFGMALNAQDLEARFTVTPGTAGEWVNVYWRSDSINFPSQNGYRCDLNLVQGNVVIYEYTNGSPTSLDSDNTTYPVGTPQDVVLRHDGDQFTLTIGGVQRLAATTDLHRQNGNFAWRYELYVDHSWRVSNTEILDTAVILVVNDLLHAHTLSSPNVQKDTTTIILDNPDSVELGAGWETVT